MIVSSSSAGAAGSGAAGAISIGAAGADTVSGALAGAMAVMSIAGNSIAGGTAAGTTGADVAETGAAVTGAAGSGAAGAGVAGAGAAISRVTSPSASPAFTCCAIATICDSSGLAPPAFRLVTAPSKNCRALATSVKRSGVAARSSSSQRFITCSTAHAASPRRVRPTMRPLPFSVWNPRRIVRRTSTFCGTSRACWRLSAIVASTSPASSRYTASSSASIVSSLAAMSFCVCAEGAAAAGAGCIWVRTCETCGSNGLASLVSSSFRMSAACASVLVSATRPASFCSAAAFALSSALTLASVGRFVHSSTSAESAFFPCLSSASTVAAGAASASASSSASAFLAEIGFMNWSKSALPCWSAST